MLYRKNKQKRLIRITPGPLDFEKRMVLRFLSSAAVILILFVPLAYPEEIRVDEARILVDTFLSYARLGSVDDCYPLLDPITRETTDRNSVKTLFENIEQEFGKIISFNFVSSEKGWKIYDDRDEQYPLISFKYTAKTEGSEKIYPVRLEVSLMEAKLWISRYVILFDVETTHFDNTENGLQALANWMKAGEAVPKRSEGKQP